MAMPLDVNLPEKWETDYEHGTDGWDLGGSAPVFERLVSSGRLQPGRMIVPGAGRGHDAREFSRHGFQVTAVDFAPHDVHEMNGSSSSQQRSDHGLELRERGRADQLFPIDQERGRPDKSVLPGFFHTLIHLGFVLS